MEGFVGRTMQSRLYRAGRVSLLLLAACYVAMILDNAARFRGVGPGMISFTLQELKADVYDSVSVISWKLFDFGVGNGTRPTRYALICEQTGRFSEAENAESERRVKRQLADDKSGTAYADMMEAYHRGDTQPIFVLSPSARSGAEFCPADVPRQQECTCGGRYKATERSRIPASDLFSEPKPLQH